jgi:hypothetical protein
MRPLAETATNMTYRIQNGIERRASSGAMLWVAWSTRGGATAILSSRTGPRSAGAISRTIAPCASPNQKNVVA